MHGIMYLRKSREDEQYEKNTGEDVLQIHRERLSMLCNSLNITFEERAEVVSGDTIAGRPKFQSILNNDFPSGKYDCIIVTEISRLGRGDMEDAGKIYKSLITYNIKIVTPNRTYDLGNSADQRQLRFELFLSREEYEGIKERLWNNRNYRATQGYAGNYIVTLGFRQSRGNVEIIPEEANLVREIFAMRAEGYSYQEIANYFNSRNLLTKRGTKYHASTIDKILKNPRYISIARWRGKQYKAKHPAIISTQLWDKVQEMNIERHHVKRGTREDNSYLVEIYCHECGNRMYGEHTKPRRLINGTVKIYKGIDVYICSGRKKGVKCTHRVQANFVHAKIFKELKKIVYDPYVLAKLTEERNSRLNVNSDNLKEQIIELDKQIKLKRDLLVKVENDYENGDLSALLYTKHVDKTNREINVLETRIKKIKNLQLKSNIKIESPETLMSVLKSFLDNWDSYSNRSKKLIIRSFLPRIEIDKENNFYIATSLPASITI